MAWLGEELPNEAGRPNAVRALARYELTRLDLVFMDTASPLLLSRAPVTRRQTLASTPAPVLHPADLPPSSMRPCAVTSSAASSRWLLKAALEDRLAALDRCGSWREIIASVKQASGLGGGCLLVSLSAVRTCGGGLLKMVEVISNG
jgi:hypothetical protein